MSVFVILLQSDAVPTTNDAKCSGGKSHHAWIVPALFNWQGIINDSWYLRYDRTL